MARDLLLLRQRVVLGPLCSVVGSFLRMLHALGAAGSLLDLLQSLTSSKSTSTTTSATADQNVVNPFDRSCSETPASTGSCQGGGCRSSLSPQTLGALIEAQAQLNSTSSANSAPTNPSGALKDLFSQIDADGNGSIDKSEFENALGAGGTNLAAADDVFGKLDADGSGSVNLDELKSALQGGHHGHHHHTQAASSSLTPDLATDAAGSDGSTDSSSDSGTDSKTDKTNPTDPNFNANPLRHLSLTLVQLPLTDLVRIDGTANVNTAAVQAL
jgi:EF-hand domain pair